MSGVAIRVENLSKRYRIGQYVGSGVQYKTLRESLTNAVTAPFRQLKYISKFEFRNSKSGQSDLQFAIRNSQSNGFIWALRDISFEVKRGEVLGIIGRNGAGKSTLLKILTGITEPTDGRAELKGRVNSLLEVGTGFHPELTGRENVRLSGAILGMTRKEIDRKFDEIVDFSGVEKFIDTPVKRYSSGMSVRLGFAVAAHLEPEILLVDEVLAVGDAAFQKKCLGKMGNVAREGRTVLFVSHNMAAVTRLCDRVLLLSSGTLTYSGDVADTIEHYLQSGASTCSSHVDLRDAPRWHGNRQFIFTSVSTHRLDGTETSEFVTGEGMMIRIRYHLDGPISGYCQANILNYLGDRVMTLLSTHNGAVLNLSGDGSIECVIHDLRLISGEYALMLEIGRAFPYREWLDCVPEASRIRVSLGNYLGGHEIPPTGGVIAQRSDWSVLAEGDENGVY